MKRNSTIIRLLPVWALAGLCLAGVRADDTPPKPLAAVAITAVKVSEGSWSSWIKLNDDRVVPHARGYAVTTRLESPHEIKTAITPL